MKKLALLFIIPLLMTGCNKQTSSQSSISESSSSSVVIDYGKVTFDDIYLFPDGYDGVKIRPYFSNEEVEDLVEFTYTVEDESICEIDEDNLLWFKEVGSTKVTVSSDYYEDDYFFVKCQNTMMPEFVFNTAKDMNRSTLNNYTDGASLFVGDSFFQFWRDGTTGVERFSKSFEGLNVFNIGISASTTHDIRAMYQNTVSLTNPKNIIVNIGINNVDDDSENGVKCFRNIKALVDDYLEYFPETNVYYLSITRCSGTFANKWSEHSMSNKMMEKYCEETDRLTYLDVMALYGDNYASYQSDGLHPNQAGYDLFEQIIKENVEF
jgi:lysophospholipase L1-like esterase